MKLDIKLPVVYHASERKDDNFPYYVLAAGEHARYYLRDPADYMATHSKKWTINEIIKECCDACEALVELWRVNG